MTEVIAINGLSKSYGKIKAIDDVSFTVERGNVFGILGPNGSGKTTTLSVITGLLKPQKGSFRWFGTEYHKSINQRIGSLIEIPNFYPYLSLYQNLQIITNIKSIPDEEINRVLGIVNLLMRKHSRYDTLSLGMKQRLGLAAVLLGDPEVLVLDEPASGLDPEGIAEVRNIILSEARKGKTIILASHILDEVEKVCTHVGILKWGKLIASGFVNELLTEDDKIVVSTDNLNELYELLVRSGKTKSIQQKKNDLTIVLKENVNPGDINEFVFKHGFILNKLEIKKKSLESQFLELVK
jgi:ABC-type multidrug transport system ATPase subunit